MHITYGRSNVEIKSYGHEVWRCEVEICCVEYPGTTGTTGEPGELGKTHSSQVSMQISMQVSTRCLHKVSTQVVCPCYVILSRCPMPCWA